MDISNELKTELMEIESWFEDNDPNILICVELSNLGVRQLEQNKAYIYINSVVYVGNKPHPKTHAFEGHNCNQVWTYARSQADTNKQAQMESVMESVLDKLKDLHH